MRSDIAEMNEINNAKTKHNLTRNGRTALKQFMQSDTLIINKADKGSTIVVIDKTDYISEGLEHLSDTKTYTKLNNDRTKEVIITIRNTLEKLKKIGLLSPRMAE